MRRRIKARAKGRCEYVDRDGKRCTRDGTDLHHKGNKHDHRDLMLMWICEPHHKGETQKQAKAAQHAKYVAARRHPVERHPGAPPGSLPWIK